LIDFCHISGASFDLPIEKIRKVPATLFNNLIQMEILLSLGQWQGFYQYGPAYGEYVEGKEAEFRLFIEEFKDGEFKGRAIDWDGFGTNGEVSLVNGFVEDGFISLTKKYSRSYIIDEWGNHLEEEGKEGHIVEYEGFFDRASNCFTGTWEIVTDLEHTQELTLQHVVGGTWSMHRHPD
jgi:hypothetical protein